MKKIVVLVVSLLTTIGLYAQPNGSCYTGTTHLGNDGKLYGCVNEEWRPLAEKSPTTSINITGDFLTQRVGNTVYVKENGKAYDMKNVGFTPIDINGIEHQIGKIIYSSTNKHFYEGVENGKWWQIDNSKIESIIEGYCTIKWGDEYPVERVARYYSHYKTLDGDCSNYDTNHPERQKAKEQAKNYCQNKINQYTGSREKYRLGASGSICKNKVKN